MTIAFETCAILITSIGWKTTWKPCTAKLLSGVGSSTPGEIILWVVEV